MNMIVGDGQIAKAFSSYVDDNEVLIFASGVSNSGETIKIEFEKERLLLEHYLKIHNEKKIVYFSSCSVADNKSNSSPYYVHKKAMEELIKKYSTSSYIFRLPQLFGELKRHTTLINYLYFKILDGERINIYEGAYRYVIHVMDVVSIVSKLLLLGKEGMVIDLANPYAYSIKEIVECLEIKANKKAIYNIKKENDTFNLDLSTMLAFISKNELDYGFGKSYFPNKLTVSSTL